MHATYLSLHWVVLIPPTLLPFCEHEGWACSLLLAKVCLVYLFWNRRFTSYSQKSLGSQRAGPAAASRSAGRGGERDQVKATGDWCLQQPAEGDCFVCVPHPMTMRRHWTLGRKTSREQAFPTVQAIAPSPVLTSSDSVVSVGPCDWPCSTPTCWQPKICTKVRPPTCSFSSVQMLLFKTEIFSAIPLLFSGIIAVVSNVAVGDFVTLHSNKKNSCVVFYWLNNIDSSWVW